MPENALKEALFMMGQSTVNVARTKSKLFIFCDRLFHNFIIIFLYFI